MLDTLLWGTARPLFRIGNDRWVLNQPPSEQDDGFPKEIMLHESSLTGKLFEYLLGRRGIFTINFDMLDRASCEVLIDIFNSSSDKYMRPHFNFHKEYLIRCVNDLELERMGKVNKPYKGTLIFETIALEPTIPDESSGSFHFDGTTKVAKAGLSITGDATVELWIRTPDTLDAEKKIFVAEGDVTWRIFVLANKKIRFQTQEGESSHNLDSNATLTVNTWYHIMVRRVETDEKRIVINAEASGSAADTYAANNITSLYIGEVQDGFDGLIQIMRFYSTSISGDFDYYMIEAIPSAYVTEIEIWWDFSQGNTDDLSNSNDGVITGVELYYKESFKDPGIEKEALIGYHYQSWFVQVELPEATDWETPHVFNYEDLVDKEGASLPATIPNAFVEKVQAMEDRDTFPTAFDNVSVTIGISRAGGAKPPYDITMTIIGELDT